MKKQEENKVTFKNATVLSFSLIFFTTLCFAGVVRDDAKAAKKLIAFGWDSCDRTVEELVAHADEIAAMGYDGVAVSMKYPELKKNGKPMGWGSPVYGIADFTDKDKLLSRIEPLKALNATKLKNNFVLMTLFFDKWNSWGDDAFWACACKKAALFAKIAKESGSTGVMIDTEDYPHVNQFYYLSHLAKFDEVTTRRFARQRGREFMQALMAEYPDMEILTTWLLSNQSRKTYQAMYDGSVLSENDGDLFVPFMQGLVEGLDPRATLIDGDEAGYFCEASRREFCYDYVAIRQLGMGVMPPELRGKYNEQVRAAFGLYIDSYTLPLKNGWSKGLVDGSRLKHYELNLRQAFETTDKYVWIWGERHSFANWKNTISKSNIYSTWEEALPGVSSMQNFLKNPKGYGDKLWAACQASGKPLANLIPIDGSCVTISNKVLVGTTAKGLGLNPGRVRKDGITPACEYVADGHDGKPGVKVSGTFAASVTLPAISKLDASYGAIYRASVWFKCSPTKYAMEPSLAYSKAKTGHPIWNDGGGWMATDFKQPGGHKVSVNAGKPDKDGWRQAVVYFRADAFDRAVNFSAGVGRRLWEGEWVIVSDPEVVMILPPPHKQN